MSAKYSSHQFLVQKKIANSIIVKKFLLSEFDGWQLQTAQDLPVVHMVDSNGEKLGWLLGWAERDGIAVRLELRFNAITDNYQELERELYACSGRWIAIFISKSAPRVYIDPLASLSLVYSTTEQMLASTPPILNATYKPVYNEQELLEKDFWYPFGATPYTGINRLLANHYLDLNTMKAKRHWPLAGLPEFCWRHKLPEVTTIMRQQLTAFANWHPIRLGLTAGLESRVLLAIAMTSEQACQFWTREDNSRSAKTDLAIAKKLAKLHSLEHEVIYSAAVAPLTEQQIAALLEATGYCIGGSPIKSAALIDSIHSVAFSFTGIGGEIARSYYHPASTTTLPVLSFGNAMAAMKLPQHTLFKTLADNYLANLPDVTESQRWSLFYQENRVSAFGAVHRYAYQNGIIFISPFSHRAIIDTMLQVSRDEQLQNAFHIELIKQNAPQLLNTPVNPMSLRQQIKRRLSVIKQLFA